MLPDYYIGFQMRLTAMADAFHNKNNCVTRLIKRAEFDQSDTSIMDINYTFGQKITNL